MTCVAAPSALPPHSIMIASMVGGTGVNNPNAFGVTGFQRHSFNESI